MADNISISPEAKTQIAQALKPVLADTYLLLLKTHNFHWNVTGPQFVSLHTLFEEQYKELFEAVDEIAERIRALGHVAPGSFGQFAQLGSVAEADDAPPAAEAMVRLLVEAHSQTINTIRAAFPSAEEGGDEGTADLLTDRLRVHEKAVWMLTAIIGQNA